MDRVGGQVAIEAAAVHVRGANLEPTKVHMPNQLAGVAPVGPQHTTNTVLVKVQFAQPFAAPPSVVVSMLVDDRDNPIRYGAVVLEVRADGFIANVGMFDGHVGWGENPSLSWIATEHSNA